MKRHRYVIHVALIVTFLFSYSSSTTRAGDPNWPQFRGPGGLGIAPDVKTYPAVLDMSKNLLWNTEVPEGFSSPCIWADRIFITACSGNKLETLCIDRKSGEIEWRKSVEASTLETISNYNSHASPTPTSDGTRVYVYFGSCGLIAYGLDGSQLWRKDLPVPQMQHGSASSPMLADDLVIINCDQQTEPYLLALNRATGEQVWKIGRPDIKSQFSWATPVLWKHGQRKELVVLGRRLIAYDPKDGREIWSVQGLPIETASTPVYTEEAIFAMATVPFTGDPVNPVELPDYKELIESYDRNGDGKLEKAEIPDDLALLYRIGPEHMGVKSAFQFLDSDKDGYLNEETWKMATAGIASRPVKQKDIFLAVKGGGEGDVTGSNVLWRINEGIGQVSSPLVYRGRAYLVKHGGNITCFNAKTGEKVYGDKLGQRVYYFASPVAADGKIYVCSYLGTVFVVKAGDEFKIISQTKTQERIKATPALVDGNVYLRTAKHIMAFGGS